MTVDWNGVRAEFPALANWTYLNTATYGQLSRRSTARVAEHFARRDERACSDFLSWFDDLDSVRDLAARLVHCERADIAFIQNASTALGWLIAGLDWKPGDRVVTLESEFPNNIYAPSVLGRRGIELNYVTGFVPPLDEIGAFLRRRGVLFYVDGTQSVGALRLDVGRVQPDMLAVHGYKWLNSPDGAGFMYVKPALRKRLPPVVVGWRSHRDWRNVDNLHHGTPEFAEGAEKYEGGMLPFALLYAMQASLEFVFEIGPEAIEHRVLELAGHVRDVARELGGEPVSVNSAIVPVRFEGRDPSKLARALKEKRVLVAARHGLLRVSTHFYNNESDIEHLRTALTELL